MNFGDKALEEDRRLHLSILPNGYIISTVKLRDPDIWNPEMLYETAIFGPDGEVEISYRSTLEEQAWENHKHWVEVYRENNHERNT